MTQENCSTSRKRSAITSDDHISSNDRRSANALHATDNDETYAPREELVGPFGMKSGFDNYDAAVSQLARLAPSHIRMTGPCGAAARTPVRDALIA
jgi:hypothetical protein